MSAVGVRALKNRLTHYLRRARQGETDSRGTFIGLKTG